MLLVLKRISIPIPFSMGRSSTVHAMVHHSTNPCSSTVPQKVPHEYIYCNPRCYLPNISGFDCIPGAVAMLGPPRPRPLPPDFWGGDFGRNSSIFSSNGSSSDSSFSNREVYTLGLKFELVNSGPTVTHPSKGRNSSFYNEDKECMMGHLHTIKQCLLNSESPHTYLHTLHIHTCCGELTTWTYLVYICA